MSPRDNLAGRLLLSVIGNARCLKVTPAMGRRSSAIGYLPARRTPRGRGRLAPSEGGNFHSPALGDSSQDASTPSNAMRQDKPPKIRQVQLASGRVIEVQRLGYPHERTADGAAQPVPTQEPQRAAQIGTELHTCPRCDGRLVYPLDWADAGSSFSEVSLRCPECEWRGNRTFSQATVERFDAELDRAVEGLLRDLKHLAHANMCQEIERFVQALEADHIVPSDF